MISLALNIIIGPSDEEKLNALFRACRADKAFDEIVIVDTFGMENIIGKGKTVFHAWTSERYPYGNFSEARNEALKHTKSDYIMWLDCDDTPPSFEEIIGLKQSIDRTRRDFYFMPYVLNNKSEVLRRERIFKNGMKWIFPVHEQVDLSMARTYGTIENVAVYHEGKGNVERNIKILENEIAHGNLHSHIRFSYARDLILANRDKENAVILLEDIVFSHEMNDEALAMCCSIIAQETGDELFARIGLSLNENLAELLVILGDRIQENSAIAIESVASLYASAMGKVPAGIATARPAYYSFIPARRLVELYEKNGNIELALLYNKILDDKVKREELIRKL